MQEIENIIQKAKENIREKVHMQEAGQWLFGTSDPRRWLCPFHDDRHPGSVSSYDGGRKFHCFSCGADGDVFSLVMQVKHCTFRMAVYEIAAAFDGILSDEEFQKLSAYMHCEKERHPRRLEKESREEAEDAERAPAYILDMVYSIFMKGRSLLYPGTDVLTMSDRRYLLSRGITPEAIRENQYFTMPEENILPCLTERLAEKNYAPDILIGVPGFYHDGETGAVRMCEQSGIGIPIHDVDGRVTAIQIRRTDNRKMRYVWYSSSTASHPERKDGVSSGSPQDVLTSDSDNDRDILITEGHFKADAFRRYGKMSAISVQGIASYRDIQEPLRELVKRKHKTCRILIGFDSDMCFNDAVYLQASRMAEAIAALTLPAAVVYLFWDCRLGKGLDDVLLAHHEKEIHMAEKEAFEETMNRFRKLPYHTKEEKIAGFREEVISRLSQRYLP